eukprot:1384297-Amorphochlora_amoeboformis.AAC.2
MPKRKRDPSPDNSPLPPPKGEDPLEVTIVGGGIIGASIAYYLHEVLFCFPKLAGERRRGGEKGEREQRKREQEKERKEKERKERGERVRERRKRGKRMGGSR